MKLPCATMLAESRDLRSRAVMLRTTRGFTITELLVVISIMAILSAILVPALNRGRSRSQAISCLNNLRQLQVAWQMYVDDNSQSLPENNYVNGAKLGSLAVSAGPSWCPGKPTDPVTEIKRGLIFPYSGSTRIYHCPSDDSMVDRMDGKGPVSRARSYSMSGSIGCFVTGYPTFSKFSEIVNPEPSKLFVFLDSHPDTLMDGHFIVGKKAWIDMPSSRHNQGGNFSFADGHIERWPWAVEKVFNPQQKPKVSGVETKDLQRIQTAMRPLN